MSGHSRTHGTYAPCLRRCGQPRAQSARRGVRPLRLPVLKLPDRRAFCHDTVPQAAFGNVIRRAPQVLHHTGGVAPPPLQGHRRRLEPSGRGASADLQRQSRGKTGTGFPHLIPTPSDVDRFGGVARGNRAQGGNVAGEDVPGFATSGDDLLVGLEDGDGGRKK